MLETEILKGGSEVIGRISAEWITLCKEGASNEPFLRPEWFDAFVRNFENEIDLITVRRNGKHLTMRNTLVTRPGIFFLESF